MKTIQTTIIVLVGLFVVLAATAQPGSPKCIAAERAVENQRAKIEEFETHKDDDNFQGSARTVYDIRHKALVAQLDSLIAAEKIFCSAQEGPIEFAITPNYMVLTVLYAPLGTSGGKGASFVEYAKGGSAGTVVSTSKSFKSDNSVTATLSAGSSEGVGGSVSLGLDWTESKTTKNEISIKNSDKNDIKVSAPGTDGIDHNEDRIYLWLNPIVHVTVNGKKITYGVGVNGPQMDYVYVYAAWMKNPELMETNGTDTAKRLASHGLTREDFSQILTADPFATGATTIDPRRFVRTSTTFPYEPPLNPNDGPTVQTYTLTSDQLTTDTEINENSFSIDLKVTVSAGAPGIAKVSLSNEDKWTWTHGNSEASSTGISESATAAVGDPAFGYTGPSDIAVYWDTVFHSFLFMPVSSPVSTSTDHGAFATGTITDTSGHPVAGQEILLTTTGLRCRTFTDKHGQYRFFGLGANSKAQSGELRIGAITRAVTVGSKLIRADFSLPVR